MADTSFGKFGIKEVADVKFYKITNGTASETADLEFDTLKVSNLEFTSEEAFARGGKGNPKLITWDYNREATLTLQDALLSMETLAMIFGATGGKSIEINADKYPEFYKIEGTTWARTLDGTDKLFTFTIPKAKISSNVTLTMEAEGDPTVFDMTITALQSTDSSGNKQPLVTLSMAEKTA